MNFSLWKNFNCLIALSLSKGENNSYIESLKSIRDAYVEWFIFVEETNNVLYNKA